VLAWLICLQRGADLHMAQLMPLPLTVSCLSQIQIGFTFLVPAHLGSPGQTAIKRVYMCYRCSVVCLSVCLSVCWSQPRAEPVEMPFEMWPRLRPGNRVLGECLNPQGEGGNFGTFRILLQRIGKVRHSVVILNFIRYMAATVQFLTVSSAAA